jgi:LPXTG-motif cell wall-anchored protein
MELGKIMSTTKRRVAMDSPILFVGIALAVVVGYLLLKKRK